MRNRGMRKLGFALGWLIVFAGVVQLAVLGWYAGTRDAGQAVPTLYLAALGFAAALMVVVGGVILRSCRSGEVR